MTPASSGDDLPAAHPGLPAAAVLGRKVVQDLAHGVVEGAQRAQEIPLGDGQRLANTGDRRGEPGHGDPMGGDAVLGQGDQVGAAVDRVFVGSQAGAGHGLAEQRADPVAHGEQLEQERDPARTLVLVMASDRDDRVGQDGPKALWAALGHIPSANKDFVLVGSDEHGTPALVADHFLSLSGSGDPPDALDFFGPWKLLDALQDCTVRRQDCRVAFGGTPQQRFMGR